MPAGNTVEEYDVGVIPVAICGHPVPPGERREMVYETALTEVVQLRSTCGAPFTQENVGVIRVNGCGSEAAAAGRIFLLLDCGLLFGANTAIMVMNTNAKASMLN